MFDQIDKMNFGQIWDRFRAFRKDVKCKDPYSRMKVVSESFDPPISCCDTEILLCSIIEKLILYAYPTESSYGKFTISYRVRQQITKEI